MPISYGAISEFAISESPSSSVSGNASGSLSPLNLSAINGSSTASSTASSTIDSISLSAITGVANGTSGGDAVAVGSLDAIDLNAITANGLADSVVTTAFLPVSLSAITGSANGSSGTAVNWIEIVPGIYIDLNGSTSRSSSGFYFKVAPGINIGI